MESLEELLEPSTLAQAQSPLLKEPPALREAHFEVPLLSSMPEAGISSQKPVSDKNPGPGRPGRRQTSTASTMAQSHSLNPRRAPLLIPRPPSFPCPSLDKFEVNALQDTVSVRLSSKHIFTPLLPISQLASMVEMFLEDFNSTFPIFHAGSLRVLCRYKVPEPGNDSMNSAWWACMNAIVAIVTQSRATDSAFRKVSEHSWSFFKNAFSAFEDIIVMEPSILAIQATITMASFLERSTDLSTTILLTSMAMRMIQLMGLHKEDSNNRLSRVEAEQRRRVVWTAFLFDTTICAKARQPPTLDVSCIQLNLPDEISIDDHGSLNDPGAVPYAKIFRLRIQLAIIYSQLHKYVLNETMESVHGHFIEDEILALYKDLVAWQRSIPITIRPNCDIHPKPSTQGRSILLLHLAYYECVGLMQTATDLYNSRQIEATRRRKEPFSSPTDFQPLYYTYNLADAARATLGLVGCMDSASFVDVW
jgi:hypothetical protein